MWVSRGVRCGAVILTSALVALTGCAGDSQVSLGPEPPLEPDTSIRTSPSAPAPEELRHEQAVEIVASATTRQNVSSIMMSTVPGTDLGVLQDFISEQDLGGFIFMGSNIPETPEQLSELTAQLSPDASYPILLGIDQEGGVVSRLPWDDLPGADTLKSEDPAVTEASYGERAALLAHAGINLNFGIVADFTDDPSSFIFDRALGTTSENSAVRVAAAVAGEQGSALSTLKHFPGHGSAPGDSHQLIPESDLDRATWESRDAVPFRAGIDAGSELLMYGHLRYPAIDPLPASLSPEWHRIAREELGFSGVTVTDDLAMLLASGDPSYRDPTQNAIQALNAGNDLLLHLEAKSLPEMIEGVSMAVDSGAIPEERLEEAAVRVAELRLKGAAPLQAADPAPH